MIKPIKDRILRSRSINNALEWLRSYNNTTFSLYLDVFVTTKKKKLQSSEITMKITCSIFLNRRSKLI